MNENSRKALDEDVSFKRRSLRVTHEDDGADLTKWSPLGLGREVESKTSAGQRAKQSRDRILEIEDEMAALAEKQVARERRAARLKALVAESAEETEAAQSAIKSVSFRSRREQSTLEE